MKRNFILAALLVATCTFTAAIAHAQDQGFGAGVILGDPTGISAKIWLHDSGALDAAAAWSFIGQTAFHIHADYLFSSELSIDIPDGSTMLHYGAGGMLKNANDPVIGIRVPVGMAYWFDSVPVDIFIEIAVIIELLPATDVDFQGGIGVRYFF